MVSLPQRHAYLSYLFMGWWPGVFTRIQHNIKSGQTLSARKLWGIFWFFFTCSEADRWTLRLAGSSGSHQELNLRSVKTLELLQGQTGGRLWIMMVVRLWFIWGLKARECVYMRKGSGWCFLCLNMTVLGVPWLSSLGLGFTAMARSIPGWGTMILQHAAWPKSKQTQKVSKLFSESVPAYDVIFQVFPQEKEKACLNQVGKCLLSLSAPPPEPHPSLHLACLHVLLSSSRFNCEEAMNGYS